MNKCLFQPGSVRDFSARQKFDRFEQPPGAAGELGQSLNPSPSGPLPPPPPGTELVWRQCDRLQGNILIMQT